MWFWFVAEHVKRKTLFSLIYPIHARTSDPQTWTFPCVPSSVSRRHLSNTTPHFHSASNREWSSPSICRHDFSLYFHGPFRQWKSPKPNQAETALLICGIISVWSGLLSEPLWSVGRRRERFFVFYTCNYYCQTAGNVTVRVTRNCTLFQGFVCKLFLLDSVPRGFHLCGLLYCCTVYGFHTHTHTHTHTLNTFKLKR